MLNSLIDALLQDGVALDYKSLADTLWLANAMGIVQEQAPASAAPEGADPGWETTSENAPASAKPEPLVIPPTDYGTLQAAPRNVEKALLKPASTRAEGGGTAKLGALPTLADRPGFKRAVKPFLAQHRQASARLDERLTLDRLTDEGPHALKPVYLPGSRRSLRLSVIRERHGTNALWTQPLDELTALFRAQGTAKQQREWTLAEDDATSDGLPPAVALTELDRLGRPLGASRKADKIKWWPGEILLLASDFTSAGWRNGSYLKLLRAMAVQQPIVLLHTLPVSLWSRSWTGSPDAWVSSAQPLIATRAMEVHVRLQGQAAVRDDSRLAIPLIEFASAPLKAWAKGVMGGAGRIPAILLDEREPEPESYDSIPGSGVMEAKLLTMQFRMASSPMARSLAQHLSVTAPLSFPVMRWVQQATLPESQTSHLVEFVLGGLLEALPCVSGTPADEVIYDFVEGVRPMLQQGMPKALGLDIQMQVGRYLEKKHGEHLDMRAVVETWSEEQIRQLSPEQQSFAEVSRAFLERIGLRPRSTAVRTSVEARETVVPAEQTARPEALLKADAGSPPSLDRVRTLREPILDLRWSPSGEDWLVMRMASAIDVWQPAHEAAGMTIRRHQGIDYYQEPVITLLWWAPGELPDDNVNLAAVKTIVRRVTDALSESLSARLRVRRLSSPSVLAHRRFNTQALIVFQTEGYLEWADDHYEQFKAINDFAQRKDVVSTCVVLGAQQSAHPGVGSQVRIRERFNLKSAGQFESQVWRELGTMVSDLRERLLRRFPQSYKMMRLTAASWLSANQLAVAEFDGTFTRVQALKAENFGQRNAVDSELLALHPGDVPLTQLFRCPAALSSAADSESPKGPFFGVDADGATYMKDGDALREVIPGAGLPRRPVLSVDSTRWWVTGEGANLITALEGGKPPQVDVPLLPGRGGQLEDDLQALLHDQVFVAWARDDMVFAITAAGLLHYGSLYDLPGRRRKTHRPLDQDPLNLHGILRGASVSADGRRFVTVTASGRLDLWETEGFKRLNSWQVMKGISQVRRVSVALSATGQRIAFANGKTVRVIDEPVVTSRDEPWVRQVLWVDDRPWNNESVRRLLASKAISCTLALDTAEALRLLETRRFVAIISDMGRVEGPTEGYRLLEAIRERRNTTPYFIYAGSDSAEHREQALARGAQGSSNNPFTLFAWITDQVDKASGLSQVRSSSSGRPDPLQPD
ncbi:response regulator [Pseudomonas sp. TWI672]|uniref:response regulator n=1 Tax=unclassified Pseudomonas TaxID=196821 RepID=UPI003208797D